MGPRSTFAHDGVLQWTIGQIEVAALERRRLVGVGHRLAPTSSPSALRGPRASLRAERLAHRFVRFDVWAADEIDAVRYGGEDAGWWPLGAFWVSREVVGLGGGPNGAHV